MNQASRDADVTLWLPVELSLLLRRIEAGTLRIGSRGADTDEEPVHRLRSKEAYYVGTFPLTQTEYRVEQVTWEESVVW